MTEEKIIIELEGILIEINQCKEQRKKSESKWTGPRRFVGQYQMFQLMCKWNLRGKKKKITQEKVFVENNG